MLQIRMLEGSYTLFSELTEDESELPDTE